MKCSYLKINKIRTILLIEVDSDLKHNHLKSKVMLNSKNFNESKEKFDSNIINLKDELYSPTVEFRRIDNEIPCMDLNSPQVELMPIDKQVEMININLGFYNNKDTLKRVTQGFLFLRNLSIDLIKIEKITQCTNENIDLNIIKRNIYSTNRTSKHTIFSENNTDLSNLREILFLKENVEETTLFRKKFNSMKSNISLTKGDVRTAIKKSHSLNFSKFNSDLIRSDVKFEIINEITKYEVENWSEEDETDSNSSTSISNKDFEIILQRCDN